jgi:hypothetical protein
MPPMPTRTKGQPRPRNARAEYVRLPKISDVAKFNDHRINECLMVPEPKRRALPFNARPLINVSPSQAARPQTREARSTSNHDAFAVPIRRPANALMNKTVFHAFSVSPGGVAGDCTVATGDCGGGIVERLGNAVNYVVSNGLQAL